MHSASQECLTHQRIINLGEFGVEAFVVIDSHLGGGGTGGIRMHESVTLDEVADLAHEMTLKFAWLNIPRGGAKSGIAYKGGKSNDIRKRLLEEFGKSVSDLLQSREYVPGADLGIGPAELEIITGAAGIQASASSAHSDIDASYFTAVTVFVALTTLLRQAGEDVSRSDVLVEGIGNVGTHLLQMLVIAGARIVGVSTVSGAIVDPIGIDVEKLMDLKRLHGDDCVKHYSSCLLLSPEALFLQPANVLVPGARPYSINETNVNKIKTRFVAPIANLAASPQIEKRLHGRGLSYIPGFVSNSGGIMCWYLARLSGQEREKIIRQGLARKIRRLIEEARRKNLSIAELARAQAQKNATRMTQEESGSFLQRAAGLARKLAPHRLLYIAICRLLGKKFPGVASRFYRSYYTARYFR